MKTLLPESTSNIFSKLMDNEGIGHLRLSVCPDIVTSIQELYLFSSFFAKAHKPLVYKDIIFFKKNRNLNNLLEYAAQKIFTKLKKTISPVDSEIHMALVEWRPGQNQFRLMAIADDKKTLENWSLEIDGIRWTVVRLPKP